MALTVPFEELLGSGRHAYDANGGQAIRRLLCDYALADTLCSELLGFVRLDGMGQQTRTPPDRHPTRAYLYCRSARYEGMGAPALDANGLLIYPKAVVTAIYQPLEPIDEDLGHTTYITERREFGGEWHSVPSTRLRWDRGNGDPVGEEYSVGLYLPIIAIYLTIHHWFAAPVESGRFEMAVGKINEMEFRGLWTTWPSETLRFDGATTRRELTSEGLSAWQVQLQFRFRRIGWNTIYRRSTGQFEAVATANGQLLYETMDFTEMLP